MDRKLIMDLAKQFGIQEGEAASKVKEYKGKTEAEIMSDIMKMKTRMKKNPEMYQQQMQALKLLASSMNGQQKARLQKVIELLES